MGRRGRAWRRRTRADDKRDNQLHIKRLKQVSRLRVRRGRPCGAHSDVGARSQIRDPAPKLGADEVRVGRDDARSTNPPPKPSGGMLGRDWCRRGGKRSRYDVLSSSSRACNTILSVRLRMSAYGNVAIRQGRWMPRPQVSHINRIGRR